MNNVRRNIPSIIFNLAEFLIIFLLGAISKVSVEKITFLCVLFTIIRSQCNKPMHYQSPFLCMIWSAVVFESFFLVTKINMPIAMILTAFGAIILTKDGDIKNMFMYKRKDSSKYIEMKKYIKENKNSVELERFEKILKNLDEQYGERYKNSFYDIYQLYFKEEKTFKEILDIKELYDNHEITKYLDIIFVSFNTYINTCNDFEGSKNKKGLTNSS